MNSTEMKRFLAEIAGMGGRTEGSTGIAWAKVLEPWSFNEAMAHLVEVQTNRTRPAPSDFNRQLLEAPAKEADAEALAWSQAKTLIQRYGLGSALSLAAAGRLTGDPVTDAAVVAARQDIRYGSADAAWWRFRDAYRATAVEKPENIYQQLGARPPVGTLRSADYLPALPEVAS